MKFLFLVLTTICLNNIALGQNSMLQPSEFSAVTESEMYITIDLRDNHRCKTVRGIYPVEDEDVTQEYATPCTWLVENRYLILSYKTGVIEKYEINRSLSFYHFGADGSALGLQPLTGEKYPISHGRYLWLTEALDKLFER